MCESKTNLHPDVEVITVAEERKGTSQQIKLTMHRRGERVRDKVIKSRGRQED